MQLGVVDPLDAERTNLLTGAVREGLLNVEKHAGASTVVVSIGPVDGGVQVAVADDGGLPGEDAVEAPTARGWACACSRSGPRGSAAGSASCTTRTAGRPCGCCCRGPRGAEPR